MHICVPAPVQSQRHWWSKARPKGVSPPLRQVADAKDRRQAQFLPAPVRPSRRDRGATPAWSPQGDSVDCRCEAKPAARGSPTGHACVPVSAPDSPQRAMPQLPSTMTRSTIHRLSATPSPLLQPAICAAPAAAGGSVDCKDAAVGASTGKDEIACPLAGALDVATDAGISGDGAPMAGSPFGFGSGVAGGAGTIAPAGCGWAEPIAFCAGDTARRGRERIRRLRRGRWSHRRGTFPGGSEFCGRIAVACGRFARVVAAEGRRLRSVHRRIDRRAERIAKRSQVAAAIAGAIAEYKSAAATAANATSMVSATMGPRASRGLAADAADAAAGPATTVTAVTRPERTTWTGVARRVAGATRVTGVSGEADAGTTFASRASVHPRASDSASSRLAQPRAGQRRSTPRAAATPEARCRGSSRRRRISAFAAS